MRRTDREIKKCQDLLDVLNRCDTIRLGINSPDYPYIVPMNFGVDISDEMITIWLHCANEGLKLVLIKADNRVGFEADCSHNFITGKTACSYTMEYESIIGGGIISVCADNDNKLRGMQAVMRHYAPERSFDFSDEQLAAVCVLRLDIKQITGKRLKK